MPTSAPWRITGSYVDTVNFLMTSANATLETAHSMIDEVQCEADMLGNSYSKVFGEDPTRVKLTAWGDTHKYSAVILGRG